MHDKIKGGDHTDPHAHVPPEANGAPAAPGSGENEEIADKEAPITSREWWLQNGPTLAIVLAALVVSFGVFDLQPLIVIKVALGLSLVIFLHELGHFLAAKWCDVKVTAFSIGFGPSIPGCRFRWGDTTYKLSLFPLGGYVQMLGQVDGEEAADGSEDDPRSYRNKSVPQRMLIISAGVTMNVILAIICFVIVFRGPGKDRVAGVIDAMDSGAPAFRSGLRTGAEILQIGDVSNPYFDNLMVRVMATMPGESLEFKFKRPQDSQPQELPIQPRNDTAKGDKKPVIGLARPEIAELLPKDSVPGDFKGPARPGSSAAEASFEFGDKVIATTDPVDPATIRDLPDDPRFPNHGRRDFFELWKRFQLLAGKEITVRVERGDTHHLHTVDIKLAPTFYHGVGARMQMGHITAVRDKSPADKAGVLTNRKTDAGILLKGDLIQLVEVTDADGKVRKFDEKNLNPEFLPFELRQWADSLEKAQVPKPWTVTLTVRRQKDFGEGQAVEPVTLKLDWDNDWRFDRYIPMGRSSPLAIAELGLAYQIKTIVAGVDSASEDSDGLLPGDVIGEIAFHLAQQKDDSKPIVLKEDAEEWASVATALQTPGLKDVVLKVKRNGEQREIKIDLHKDRQDWATADNGLLFNLDTRRQRASTTPEAISLGFSDTWDSMKQVFQNLRGMIFGRISVDQLGGPLTIATVAYKIASMDFWEFVFFLGLISVNLAVINFLPIPVLDGGHMVFLIYEGIRGKPASEVIRVGATYLGLALILCLLIFVSYLDVTR